ncbi:MAG: hypothetical protein U0946_04925 [Patescibacteria group bacterium]|nr:hypothetical protein [Patescibacteria group bacterium]
MPKKISKISGQKLLASASLAGTLLLTPAGQSLKALPEKLPEQRLPLGLITKAELEQLLKKLLKKSLPPTSRVLTNNEEQTLSDLIQSTLGLKAVAELNGNRLNHQIGLMGLEQYLKRFPGDNLSDRHFPQAGLAPGKGAWGYFAPSKNLLTASLIQKEKYYLAVQTLYLPDWQARLGELYQWYQYRKVLVINPDNGSAVIAVIADAGPAKWTGKQFGGSPQVMFDLGFYPRRTKGKVIVLFVDDPDDQIPLGPVTQPLNLPQPQLI